ncbi:phosphatase PAP2 family protein [Actinomadura hibisca]|uniref:phosphatase PAP2 family protein n=1 Tax=Actinomadura hibisca TaxID=68565 RepID=UPI0008307D3A|nr:phosphatase PAP2 family protein [Actinomadura hibisca]
MLTGFMHVMSFVGSAAFYVPLLMAVYWCVDPRTGARAAVLLTLSGVVNTVLKLFFHAPRPFWTDPGTTGYEGRDSFGMPSGHAQNSVVAWGFLSSRFRRRAVWAAALVVIVLIGVSRIYLGVHSLGQVLVGWSVGALLLAAALWLEPVVVPWWSRRPMSAQLGLALAVALVCVGAAWAGLQTLDGWRWPDAWVNAITRAGGDVAPITLSEGAAAAGGLFGILAGLSAAAHRGWYDAGGELWRRVARVPVGAAGALAIYTVGLFLGTQPVQAFIVQAALGLWGAAGAPESFVRLRLATRTTPELTRAGEERVEVRP